LDKWIYTPLIEPDYRLLFFRAIVFLGCITAPFPDAIGAYVELSVATMML
jgi:hypothetical protein